MTARPVACGCAAGAAVHSWGIHLRRLLLLRGLTAFAAEIGAAPDPIGPVDQTALAGWAQETEPQVGAGVVDAAGRYVLQLAAMAEEAPAAALAARLGTAGYAAVVSTAEVAGRSWWRVSIAGYVSRADAEAAASALREPYALASPWVQRTP